MICSRDPATKGAIQYQIRPRRLTSTGNPIIKRESHDDENFYTVGPKDDTFILNLPQGMFGGAIKAYTALVLEHQYGWIERL